MTTQRIGKTGELTIRRLGYFSGLALLINHWNLFDGSPPKARYSIHWVTHEIRLFVGWWVVGFAWDSPQRLVPPSGILRCPGGCKSCKQ